MSGAGEKTLILLAAGGTGGHMTPAVAVAQDLLSRGYGVALATDARGDKFRSLFEGMDVHVLKAGTPGGGIAGKIKGMTAIGLGLVQAYRLVGRLKPAVVVGFGGYPSFAPVYVAQRMKIPTVIHQGDAVMGRANLVLAPRADRIALSFAHVEGLDEADSVRAVLTGNPVRGDIAALYSKPYPALQQGGPLKIAVFGGSLGARVFSRVLPAVLAKLPAESRARLDIVQQCRAEDMDSVRDAYNKAGIKARLEPFFHDIAAILSGAHLVISRSGAGTVAEVTAAGRPAIFVPYPHHSDRQQEINADIVADAGGAWVMTEDAFTEDALLPRLEIFLQNPETLFRAAENARSCARPDAARRLGNLVTAIASGWDKKAGSSYDPTQGIEG